MAEMTKEIAIKILENYDVYDCGYCHQGGDEVKEAFDYTIKALQNEARVMTLEEVIERRDSDAIWVEHMDGEMIVQPAVLLPSFLDMDKECIHFASSWRTGGSYSRKSYGVKWRCWDRKPAKEQMEATPWER